MALVLPVIRETHPDRQALNWLLATVVLVLANHVGRLPAWLTLLTACGLAWRYLSENHGWRLPGRIVRVAITLALGVAIYKQFGTVFGRDAGIAFLAGLLGLKFLELRRLRDYVLVVLLGYFLMLGGFLYTQDLWVGAYMLAVTVFATATLIRLSQPTGIGLGNGLRLAGELFAKALPLMLVLYLFFPRIQGSLWGLPLDARSGLIGLSDEMRPGTINQLFQTDEIAFRVEFTGTPPKPQLRYWRALVLTDTDGQSWRRAKSPAPSANVVQGLGEPVRYTVTQEAHNRRWMFALDLPVNIPNGAQRGAGFTVEWKKPLRERARYTLTSYPRYTTGALTATERRQNLQLPPDLSPRVAALARRWKMERPDSVGIVNRALAYFRNEDFVYTLRPPLLGRDPVDEFLFEVRRGFCEHYASAFVTLMRAAGLPSRVVVGYQGGELNPSGNYFIVKQADAHAWGEVWLAGRGWVRVDPTAAVAPERIEYGIDAVRRLLREGAPLGRLSANAILSIIKRDWLEAGWRGLRLRWDTVNTAWNRWVMAFGPERQKQLMRLLGFKTPSWLGMVTAMMAGAVLSVLLVAGLMLYRRKRPDPVMALYDRFCTRLGRLGLRRAAGEGPLDFARRSGARRPDLEPAINVITRLYIGLRYGGLSGSGPIGALRRRVRAFRPR